MKKRILAMLLVLAMVLSFVPAFALSTSATEENSSAVATVVSTEGSADYATIAEALEAAQPGDMVMLLADLTETVTIEKETILDLNGHSIVCDGASALVVSANVTVTNSGAPEAEIVNITNGQAVYAKAGANLSLSGVNVNGSDVGVYVADGASLTVNDSTSISATNAEGFTGDGIRVCGNGSVTVCNGATVNGSETTGSAIELYQQADVTVESGAMLGGYWGVVVYGGRVETAGYIASADTAVMTTTDHSDQSYVSDATVNVTGGDLQGERAIYIDNCNNRENHTVNYTVSGGTLAGKIEFNNVDKSALTITGGTFTADPSEYLADGYTVTTNGVWYEVVAAENAPDVDTSVSAGTSSGSVASGVEGVDAEDVKAAVNSEETQSALEEAVYNMKDDATVVGSAEDAKAALEKAGVKVDENTEIVVEVQPYLEVEVQKVETTTGENDETVTTMTVEINAMYNVVAVAGEETAIIKEGEELTDVTMPIVIKLPLPSGFVASTSDSVYVHHYKDDGNVYTYEAEVTEESGTYYATFVNPNGFSTFEVSISETANVPEAPEVKHNLDLSSEIDFSFFIPKEDLAASGLTATVTHDCAEGYDDRTITLAQANWETVTSGGVTYWRIRYNGVAAKEMADELTLVITDADGNTVVTDVYSVQAYAKLCINDPLSDAEKNMMIALLDYGAAAQLYFNYNTDDLANSIVD